jgi:S-adenosylmethionine-diacylgycerolhomoserine-N-methlytransferase
MTGLATGHDALMDRVYRRQKHIYDLTRKYYLFGRDRLIAQMAVKPGARVLEPGCGTGRNLARIGAVWPAARLYGLDISRQMLGMAGDKLGARAVLAAGDATCFDAAVLFGTDRFDHVVLSYALSMIPDWQGAIAHAAGLLAPGGRLHIVDFGDFAGLPGPLAALLRGWLRLFHVTPRDGIGPVAARIALAQGLDHARIEGPLGYYRIIVLTRV